jgi:outer membrane receptor protein involved in Fe transport
MGVSFRTNGGQVYGREAVYGGNTDYGFNVSYGNRIGGDYDAGNGLNIPASYFAQNYVGVVGLDLTPTASVEFRFQRLDQSDTEAAAQFFDINQLRSDSYSLAYVAQDPTGFGSFKTEGWYSRTDFDGDTQLGGKRRPDFPVINRVEAALPAGSDFAGFTNGDMVSTGARAARTIGEEEALQFTMGADLHYVQHHLFETYQIVPPTGPVDAFSTNMPRAEVVDPGAYVELAAWVLSGWKAKLGARVDWAHTKAKSETGLPDGLRPDTQLLGAPGSLDQNDVLYAFYLMNDLELTPALTAHWGFGQAQRVPSPVERYADGLFLGIIQSGFSRVIGTPDLDKERAWQIDVGLDAEGDRLRGRLTAFHAWIHDYVTYEANLISDVAGARLMRTINTDLATLAGFELYGEADLTDTLAVFGTLKYIDGRDRGIDVPLGSIAPLESRIGLRLVAPDETNRWGTELGARLVDGQDRLAYLRRVSVPGIEQLEARTPGFTVFYLRGYWNVTDQLNLVAGVDNLFDRNYLEHLNLRLPPDSANGFPETAVLSPGITPYFGVEWTY